MNPVLATYLRGALAPVVVVVILLLVPQGLRDRLKDFQTLLGGAIALGAAVIGFGNIHDQITEQRQAEVRKNEREDRQDAMAQHRDRTRLASALLGEVESILIVLRNRRVAGWYEDISALMVRTKSVNFGGSMSLSSNYAAAYDSLRGDVGKLGEGLPGQVTYFYGLLQLLFDRIRAAESGTYDSWTLDAAIGMSNGIVLETREVEETGTRLADNLRRYAATERDPAPVAA